MTLDWSFVPGMDLTRDPVVTVEDGWEVRRWPGCRIFTPQALGDAEASSAIPDACREPHGAIQELLDALWPVLKECKTARQLGKAILDAGVDVKMKRPLALAAREKLGASWTDAHVRQWLLPARHSEERAEKQRESNRKTSRKAKQAWRADPVNAEKNRQRTRYAARGEYQNERDKTRRKDDPVFALTKRLRNRLAKAMKAAGTGKVGKTFDLIDLTPDELAAHLERHFLPGMTWENRDQWDVDHVRALASFDLTDPEQQRQANHWSNLRPLWRADNIAKSSLHEGKRWKHSDHK